MFCYYYVANGSIYSCVHISLEEMSHSFTRRELSPVVESNGNVVHLV